ncbi:MAG TPA: MFS transporter [Actinophytocola sp.]|jgi:MFS family permease|uniref:MFS transporter n=1 Tax=Actinophytocola sp. TaxID=1872138 RepID=UPI002E026BA4|nr:MFS transporter [Actinophytocola sp.]
MTATTLPPSGLRRVLVVLCVTEITSWGVLFYAFPVLAPGISAATGWSPSTITAAFSLGLIVSALAGIGVGRLLDRIGPRPVMTVGAVLAAPAVVLIATARSLPWFFVAWFVAGLAMSGVLYAPAFAALTRWWGPRRVTALTAVTLVAGLASTVFAPLTAALSNRFDWRGTYLVLAAVLAVITIPLHAIGLRGPWPRPEAQQAEHSPGRVARSRPFVMLAAALSLAAFAVYGVVIIQVPLLLERGLPTGTAALALGLGGVGQLCGRIGYGRLSAATSVRGRTAIVLGAGAVTIAVLGVLPGPAALLIAAAILVGAARGVFTLLQATAVTDRWGPAHYGRLMGLLSAPMLVVNALAPWACTALAGLTGGYPAVFWILAGVTALSAVLATASTRESQMTATDPSTNPPDTTAAGSTGRSAVSTKPTT